MAEDFEDNRGQFQVGQRKRSIMLIEVLQTSCWHDCKSRCISHAHVTIGLNDTRFSQDKKIQKLQN